MKVHHGEGVAIRTGPEPCVGTREGVDEASVGEHIGQPLSLVKKSIRGADAVAKVEGDTVGRVIMRTTLGGFGMQCASVWRNTRCRFIRTRPA